MAPSPSRRLLFPLLFFAKVPLQGWCVPLSTPGPLRLGKDAPSPPSWRQPSVVMRLKTWGDKNEMGFILETLQELWRWSRYGAENVCVTFKIILTLRLCCESAWWWEASPSFSVDGRGWTILWQTCNRCRYIQFLSCFFLHGKLVDWCWKVENATFTYVGELKLP